MRSPARNGNAIAKGIANGNGIGNGDGNGSGDRSRSSSRRGIEAGAARVALAAPLGAEMMGYALRQGRAEGVLDPLEARALFVRGADGAALGVVALDLCLLAPAQAARVRAGIAARTGVPPERLLVTCIHTHSGPESGMAALFAGRELPGHVNALLAAAVEAGVRAHAALAPARLGTGRAELAIGRNRRREGGPVDAAVRIVRIDRADGAPLAVVFLHGCHPTVLGHENLLYSADWPGEARAAVEAALPGAQALFLLSAHGDVDPRTRGLQDLARPGRSAGATPEAMRALGREAGAVVAQAAAAVEPQADAPVGIASARVPVTVHGGADPAAAEAALAARRREALLALGFGADDRVAPDTLWRRADECVATLPAEEARERVARWRLFVRDRTAPGLAGARALDVDVQALRLGDAAWLALPFEPTTRVGAAWTKRAGSPEAAVLSIANGWLRYLPHGDEFAEPDAHTGYEVLMSTLEPEGAERLLTRGEALLAELPAG